MEKRGVTSLVLVGAVVLIVGVAIFFLHQKDIIKVELTSEEQEKAETLGLTAKEFKEVSTKAEEFFKEGIASYKEGFLEYSKVQYENKRFFEDLEIKPNSRIIEIDYAHRMPSPYVIYLVKDGKVKVIEENLHPLTL